MVPEDGQLTGGYEVMTFAELKQLALGGGVIRRLGAYQSSEMVVPSLATFSRLLPAALLLRYMSRGSATIVDLEGGVQRITLGYLVVLTRNFVRDLFSQGALRRRIIAGLPQKADGCGGQLDLTKPVLYLRTDAVYGLVSGGSVGHIAGVLNNLDAFCGAPLFVTSDLIPTVREDIETIVWRPDPRYRDFPEMWVASSGEHLERELPRLLGDRQFSFLYQRYSLSNATGLHTARRLEIPFVCEYNGSEAWVARHWGRALRHEDFSLQVEHAVLDGADLIVVVSAPLRDELVERGIEAAKILVNPNGVDPQRYAPDVDGSSVREALGLGDRTVIGFIGTFGRWHGAEVLAEAYGRLLASRPELRETTRLLMVGDGVTMPEVREAIQRHDISEQVVLTGLVPQEQGPAHLAAMDILASPHVPNPDGTPFFGSPTKLFEYMAMGRGIVASDLDQIGEVLEHDVTAWLVKPGDADALVEGLAVLIDDPERRARLGAAAREEVLAHYTWREHTRRIIEALKERCA